MNWIISSLVVVVLLVMIVLGVEPTINDNLAVFISGFTVLILPIATLGVILLHRHTKIQKQQTDENTIQIFSTAVKLLESDDVLVRSGGIYALYKLALRNKKYRWQTAQFILSYIRSRTQEPEYQEKNKLKPSKDIQLAIDLLFRVSLEEVTFFQGGTLYFPKIGFFRDLTGMPRLLPQVDLSHAYLVGADFGGANCEVADFRYANCERANFNKALCQRADFKHAHCERVDFSFAHCEEASFSGAHCEEANFSAALCEGADFYSAHCEGANFAGAHCEGASFSSAYCQGAWFRNAYCQGTSFSGAQCQGAYADENDHHRESLADRIGKETDMSDVVISGEIGKRIDAFDIVFYDGVDAQVIKRLKKVKRRVGWHIWRSARPGSEEFDGFERLRKEQQGKPIKRGKPEGIIEGVLEDSEKLRAIIKKLEEIEQRKKEASRREYPHLNPSSS